MNTFAGEIDSFLLDVKFDNNIDSFGNVNISTSPKIISERYVAYKLKNSKYDSSKIESLYDVSIKNFNVSIQSETKSEISSDVYDKLVFDNSELTVKLNNLIEEKDANSTSSDLIASRDLIVNLRIQLGEGTKETEFSDKFPYSLIK